MTYLQRLHPWCIIRPFPDMRTLIVGRFRRRVDAEGHLRILKQMMPTVPFEIIRPLAKVDFRPPAPQFWGENTFKVPQNWGI